MRRPIVLLVAAIALAACGSDPEPTDASPATSSTPAVTASTGPTSPTGTTSPDPGPDRYDASGCPVADEAFCATAVEVIEALQAGDAGGLFSLSRRDRLVCAKLTIEYFPDCEDADDIVTGHGISGPDFSVEVLEDHPYRERLETLVRELDPSFADELGGGDARVVGVGTCGPDIPGRRTYHLAWTAATDERVLGSFELTFADDEWRIALWYLGSLDEWEAEQPDPLELAFCEAGLSPWFAA